MRSGSVTADLVHPVADRLGMDVQVGGHFPPITGPLLEWICVRTPNMDDLRVGHVVSESAQAEALPLLVVSATRTADPDHWWARVYGDGLVPVTRALGGATTAAQDTLHVGGAGHFDLLNHPAVYQVISTRLHQTESPPGPSDSATSEYNEEHHG